MPLTEVIQITLNTEYIARHPHLVVAERNIVYSDPKWSKFTFSPCLLLFCQVQSLFRQVGTEGSLFRHLFTFDPERMLYLEPFASDRSFFQSYQSTFTSPLPRQPPHAPAKIALPPPRWPPTPALRAKPSSSRWARLASCDEPAPPLPSPC